MGQKQRPQRRMLTVDARAVEDLTGLTGWACPVALDLAGSEVLCKLDAVPSGTFRLRQLLQFMASRGSLETRRVGRRSMPICGLDIAETVGWRIWVVMKKAEVWSERQKASLGLVTQTARRWV